MSIQTRKPKINTTKVVPLVGKHGRYTDYEVQGSNGKYHVYIPEKPQTFSLNNKTVFTYKVTCHDKSDPKAFPVCKGNSNGTVCYHCLAAIKDRVKRAGKKLILPKNGELASAVKLLNLGGQLVKIKGQGTGVAWGVVR